MVTHQNSIYVIIMAVEIIPDIFKNKRVYVNYEKRDTLLRMDDDGTRSSQKIRRWGWSDNIYNQNKEKNILKQYIITMQWYATHICEKFVKLRVISSMQFFQFIIEYKNVKNVYYIYKYKMASWWQYANTNV